VAAGAGRAAAGLAARGVSRGDIIVMVGTHHVDFYAVWLGAVWLGAVPTVLAEPSVRIDKALYWARLREQLARIDAKLLAVDPRVELEAGTASATYEALVSTSAAPPARVTPQADELLMLQHSSGTTGLHKGVMLSHGAVMGHAEAYLPTLGLRHDDVVASWLPLYHDMGLIACFVCPLIAGVPVVWLSPFEWVTSPALLLKAIAKHRATLTWLPNFAFAFLAQRARDPVDLSSLRAAINCSEPVTSEAVMAFEQRFTRDGLRPNTTQSCYAMAENVFAVTATRLGEPAKTVRVDAAAWRDEHRAVAGGQGPVHVSSGRVVPGCEVRVVGADGRALPSGRAGRLLIRSQFLLSGYFRRDDLNIGLRDAEGFFDTGDLGWLDADGELFVTGRAKDLVIVGGRNIYPQDIEQIANETLGVHAGRAVCFGVAVPRLATEGLVVLAESDLPEAEWPEVERRLRASVPARLDLDLSDVRVVAPSSLRKSTSGKLARSGNREWYLEGRFGLVPPHLQVNA
jgi:fatty-acyl-CoA synthase